MKSFFIILFNLLVLSSCVDASEQVRSIQVDSTSRKQDSIAASNVAVDFYKWYAEAIRLKKYGEIDPAFIKDSNGMTTLDMSVYVSSLRKNKFSQNLIDETTNRFKACSDNLKNIPYDSLKNTFKVSDYENIFCDFSSFYQWTSDAAPIDGADVISCTQYENEIILRMSFYNIYDHKKKYWTHKHVEVLLTKTTGEWLISYIQIVLDN